jgi:MFS transporter, NNP family, nitrate/nitrite transporter
MKCPRSCFVIITATFSMIQTKSSRYQWYVLALGMLTAAFVPGAARLCMPVLFKEISESLHLNLVSIGTVWGMDPLAGILVGLPAGLLADRFGIKRSLTVICIMAGIFGAARGFSVNFLTLAGSMFLLGLFSASAPNIVAKVTALWFKGQRLAMANALVNVAWSLGSMAATMFSATVLSPSLGGWTRVMFFWGAPCVVLGFIWLLTGREPAKSENPEAAIVTVPFREALSHVTHVKEMWIMGLLTLAHYGATMGFMGYLPLYLRNIGWTTTAADSSMTVLSGVGTLGVIPMVLLSNKIMSQRGVLLVSIISLTAMLALLPFVNTTGVWIIIIVGGFLRSGGPSIINVMIFESRGIGGNYGGTAMGFVSTIGMVGAFLSPPIGNSFATYAASLPLLFWAALSILAIIPWFFFTKTRTENILHV